MGLQVQRLATYNQRRVKPVRASLPAEILTKIEQHILIFDELEVPPNDLHDSSHALRSPQNQPQGPLCDFIDGYAAVEFGLIQVQHAYRRLDAHSSHKLVPVAKRPIRTEQRND